MLAFKSKTKNKSSVAYVVVKKFYGDFDIPRFENLGVSLDPTTAYADAQKRNEKLTDVEKAEEVSYAVNVVPYL